MVTEAFHFTRAPLCVVFTVAILTSGCIGLDQASPGESVSSSSTGAAADSANGNRTGGEEAPPQASPRPQNGSTNEAVRVTAYHETVRFVAGAGAPADNPVNGHPTGVLVLQQDHDPGVEVQSNNTALVVDLYWDDHPFGYSLAVTGPADQVRSWNQAPRGEDHVQLRFDGPLDAGTWHASCKPIGAVVEGECQFVLSVFDGGPAPDEYAGTWGTG